MISSLRNFLKGDNITMKKKIILTNPIKVNGKDVKKLWYDTDNITPESFARAEGLARKKNGIDAPATAVELDFTFQMYLLMVAIANSNTDIDITDLERISGTADVMTLYREGRNFIKAGVEEEETETEEDIQPADSLEEQLEPMEEPSTQTLDD